MIGYVAVGPYGDGACRLRDSAAVLARSVEGSGYGLRPGGRGLPSGVTRRRCNQMLRRVARSRVPPRAVTSPKGELFEHGGRGAATGPAAIICEQSRVEKHRSVPQVLIE